MVLNKYNLIRNHKDFSFTVKKADKEYLYINNDKYLDMTAGITHFAILGYNKKEIIRAIKIQLKKFTHIDYKKWIDPNVYSLSNIISKNSPSKCNQVYFCGNSGGEACETALKMSYQYHFLNGDKQKTWFISRNQSYHGSSNDALALGERPNLSFYNLMLNNKRAKIQMHHPLKLKKINETNENYTDKCVKELEDKILKIGPERVAGFVGETIMGGLVGDVPPNKNYWKKISKICRKYNVHLILDEVYCGTSSSGKYFCYEYDEVAPDITYIGKTLGAGYGALSAVICKKKIIDTIFNKHGRLEHSTTFQAHSLNLAAALEVQKICSKKYFINEVYKKGEYMRNVLKSELESNPFFLNVRGRGLRMSLEYDCKNKNNFGSTIEKNLFNNYKIVTSGKWHRISITPPLTINFDQINFYLDNLIKEFKKVSKSWK